MSAVDTTFFYASPEDVAGDTLRLREDEAHHLSRVLRLEAGDEIQVVDGLGGWYRVSLEDVARSGATGRILERRLGVGESPLYLHLAVASMKSRSRFDIVLEKATELGASRITVVDCARSERVRLDAGRAARVMRAAMKQCRRSRIPTLEGPVQLSSFVSAVRSSRRVICHDAAGSLPLSGVLTPEAADVVLLVGPESGFTEKELGAAIAADFVPASLGVRRLRTETACVAACARISLD